MSVFANWAPIYAEYKVATFPVLPEKRPAVTGYQRIGLEGSRKLVQRHPKGDALAFMAGRRNRITVLDIDTDDDRVLADAQARHGRSPLIVRSGSGNFHAYYRFSGERRLIRPWADRPIDVLGGRMVIAPPSHGPRDSYQIIEGTLDDLDYLPVLKAADLHASSTEPKSTTRASNGRNENLWRYCMKQGRFCDDLSSMIDIARTLNGEYVDPLGDAEVVKTARSAWEYTERGDNWFGRQVVVVDHRDVDRLAASNPEALALLTILKRHHWQRSEFAIARTMAASLGWTVARLKSARSCLVDAGVIKCLRQGGKGPGDPPTYGWR